MDDEYILSINRRIEPNCIHILDSYQDHADERGYGSKLAILSLKDEEFIVDKVNPSA